ncbi:hypothetical protein N431DRAFT_430018 [Stipitochalara longipes BDJ]|nr:hypothetical protein N431DRAFT_430018 [Stipitochalara longipes BDJ]
MPCRAAPRTEVAAGSARPISCIWYILCLPPAVADARKPVMRNRIVGDMEAREAPEKASCIEEPRSLSVSRRDVIVSDAEESSDRVSRRPISSDPGLLVIGDVPCTCCVTLCDTPANR